MKSMTCKQLGGACDRVFTAETFEEISSLSREHGMVMYKKQDPSHLEAMAEMKAMMQSPEKMKSWMEEKRTEFEQLPYLE